MPKNAIKIISYGVVLLTVTFLLFIGMLKAANWLFPSQRTYDMIDNETLLAILGLLVIFGSLLAYIFQKIIRIELKEEIAQDVKKLHNQVKEIAQAERAASRAENCVAQSNILAKLYDPNNPERKNFLAEAWDFDKRAIQDIKYLGNKECHEDYGRIILRAKNSYLCGLIEQQTQRKNNGSAIEQASKQEALLLGQELWEFIVSGKAEKYDKDIYHHKETCARAIYFFAETEEQKEKARAIIRGLDGNSPIEWYQRIKIKYKVD